MYPLFETIRIEEGRAMHLRWHQERLNWSVEKYYGISESHQLSDIVHIPEEFSQGTVKCRFLYNATDYRTEFENYKPRKVRTLKIVEADGLDYEMKYTNRSALQELLKKKGTSDEILISRGGMISDTSYSNIAFFDGNDWVTPSTPLLKGTARARLLAEGVIKEKDIRAEDVDKFQAFRLINAMLKWEG